MQGWDSNPRFPAYETGEDGLSSTLQQRWRPYRDSNPVSRSDSAVS